MQGGNKSSYIPEQTCSFKFRTFVPFGNCSSRLEEKPDTYPPNTCVLIGDSILNGVIERNLSNDRSVKGRKFAGATINDLRHHALPIIRKQPKYLSIHAGTNAAAKFTSRDVLN